jgi:DNA processing protein
MGERLGAGLAEEGVVVVSGCAIGIDAAAHHGALSAGGATVAVLGGGLDVSAPPSNRSLAERISARGCLAGEYPAGTHPQRYHFPKRNRIIAGLARIVVVVEAAARSGALITARLALEAGREAMAVPGHPLLATSAGVNALLADGARPVRSVEDVMEELEGLPGCSARNLRSKIATQGSSELSSGSISSALPGDDTPPDETEGVTRRVLAGLSAAPVSVEPLAEAIGVTVEQVLAALTRLELVGLARAHPGHRYSRTRSDGRRS